jgi:hypothetical protein
MSEIFRGHSLPSRIRAGWKVCTQTQQCFLLCKTEAVGETATIAILDSIRGILKYKYHNTKERLDRHMRMNYQAFLIN